MPRLRQRIEDFFVDEILLFPPLGRGAHTYLHVEKRGVDTARAAGLLAEAAGVPLRAVGWAGRKDRHAVARQWFSVPGFRPEEARQLRLPGLEVLEVIRHTEKLHAGELRGNRFRLVIRDVGEEEGRRAERKLAALAEHGMPNRFGAQRFGRDGKNAERGAEILGRPRLHGDRRAARLMVSALQSAVFNRVVERRAGALGELWPGDVAIDHETGLELFVPDPEALADRLGSFEISPTGPLFGTRMKRPTGRAAELEAAAMAELGVPEPGRLQLPKGLRLPGGRRALRARPRAGSGRWTSERTFEVEVELPAGTYATVLVEELFPVGLEDASQTQKP